MSAWRPSVTLWLAFLGAVKGGRERVAREIKALGIGAGISFRLGDGGSLGDGANESNTKFWLEQFGVDGVTAWMYSRPDRLEREIALWRLAQKWGVRKFCINAEVEWKIQGANGTAERYAARMRQEFPDCEVSHAPFAFRMSHGLDGGGMHAFPYVGFGTLDHVYDQLYVEEFGMSAVGAQARYDAENAAYFKRYPQLAAQSRSSVGDLYGSDLNSVWPGRVPGAWTQNSFDRHMQNAERRGETRVEFYTVDAALAETDGTKSKPWAALQAWARARVQATQSDAEARAREAEQAAADAAKYCSEELQMCLDPRAMQACYSRFEAHGGPE